VRSQLAKRRVLEAEGLLQRPPKELDRNRIWRSSVLLNKLEELCAYNRGGSRGWSFSGAGRYDCSWCEFEQNQLVFLAMTKATLRELRTIRPDLYRATCESLREQIGASRKRRNEPEAEGQQRRDDPYCYVRNSHTGLSKFMWSDIRSRICNFTLRARLQIHKNEKARCGGLQFYGTLIEAVDELWKLPKRARTAYPELSPELKK
jgi:hypothetical protein